MTLPARWYPLRWHPVQQRLWRSPARFRIVAAGRTSGKTELAKRFIVKELARPVPGCTRPTYFAAGPTYAQMRRVWWQDLKDLVPPEWLARAPYESDLRIATIFGSELHVTGMDVPARIEGTQWCGGVVDESSDVRPGAFARSIRPALSRHRGWCWRIGLPKRVGVGIVEFRRVFEAAAAGKAVDAEAFHWLSADILTPEEIAAVRTELSLEDFQEQYEARWLDEGGVLYSGFDAERTARACDYHPRQRVYVGCYFRGNPMTWVFAHWQTGNLTVFDELHIHHTTTQAMLDATWQRYPRQRAGWTFVGDAMSANNRTTASETDYATVFNDARFRAAGRQVMTGRPRADRDRVAAVNRLLCDAAGQRRLFVDPRCAKLLEELRETVNAEPVDDEGRLADALGYLVWARAPLRPELQSRPPLRVIA